MHFVILDLSEVKALEASQESGDFSLKDQQWLSLPDSDGYWYKLPLPPTHPPFYLHFISSCLLDITNWNVFLLKHASNAIWLVNFLRQ